MPSESPLLSSPPSPWGTSLPLARSVRSESANHPPNPFLRRTSSNIRFLVQDKLAYFRIKELKDVLIHLALPKHGKKQVSHPHTPPPPITSLICATSGLFYFYSISQP
jgi:hypothetical protein